MFMTISEGGRQFASGRGRQDDLIFRRSEHAVPKIHGLDKDWVMQVGVDN